MKRQQVRQLQRQLRKREGQHAAIAEAVHSAVFHRMGSSAGMCLLYAL